MAKLDDTVFSTLFSSIDTNPDGEVSLGKYMSYFNSLHQSIKEELHCSISECLKTISTQELDALWSKLNSNGDGSVSVEELPTFAISKNMGFSDQDAHICATQKGVTSFQDFKLYLYSLCTLSVSKMRFCVKCYLSPKHA